MKHLNQTVRQAWLTVAMSSALLAMGLAGQARADEAVSGKAIWRAAYVVQNIDAQSAHRLVAAARDCRIQANATADTQQWVVLRYRRVPGDVYMVAPVAAGLALKPGQSVNANVQGCQPVAQVRDAVGAAQG